MKYILKKPNKPAEILDTEEKYRSSLCGKIIGDLDSPQYINLRYDGTLGIAIADSGLLRNLPHNFFLRYNDQNETVVNIVGPVVFYRLKPAKYQIDTYDYLLDSVNKDDLVIIEQLLSDDFQAYCKKDFCEEGQKNFIFRAISEKDFKNGVN